MLKNLPKMNFDPSNICEMQDPSRAELHEKVESYKAIFQVNQNEGKQSFLLIYFGGHGCIGLASGQCIILNESNGAAAYPLEERMRCLSEMEGVAVAGIYDCSRVPASPGLSLGQTYDLEKEEYNQLKKDGAQYWAFRACQPLYQVPLDSKLAESFFQHVAKKNQTSAAIEFNDLTDFRGPYGVAEYTTTGNAKIPVYWVDPGFDVAN